MTCDVHAHKEPYRIVVGFDFSELSERALGEALDIARYRAPAEIHVITITLPEGLLALLDTKEPGPDDITPETVSAAVARLVQDNQQKRGSLGLERISIYVTSGLPPVGPGDLIVELARNVDADLIVVGTHGRKGLKRALLGSVATCVLRGAETSVYVVQPADFVRGEKVPPVQPPLAPGAPHLKHFQHRHTYHYVDKVAATPSRTMPVS